MRGLDQMEGELFSYIDLDKRVPARHPLRLVRSVVNDVLAALDGDFFQGLRGGWPAFDRARPVARRLSQLAQGCRDPPALHRSFTGEHRPAYPEAA